ncbi:MAG: Hsp20/alpha crystallin family protein [Bacteroidia bacterium]
MATKSLMKTGEMFPTVFEDFFKPWNEWYDDRSFFGKMIKVPAVNVTETKDFFMVSLAVPGLKKNDFKIDIEGNMLTISSEKEETIEEKDAKFTRKEYNYSSFSRSFTLPEEVKREKIEAIYEDGVLKLTLPKSEEFKKVAAVKHIAVK